VTLRARLTAAFLAVVLGPVLLGAVFVGLTVATVSQARAAERLDVAAAGVRASMLVACQRLRAAAETAALLTAAPAGPATPPEPATPAGPATPPEPAAPAGPVGPADPATGPGQRDAADLALLRLVQRGMATSVELSSADGAVLRSAGEAPPGDRALCDTTAEPRPYGALGVRVEIRDAGGGIAGFVTVTQRLDQVFLGRLASASGAAISVIAGGRGLSTEADHHHRQVIAVATALRGSAVAATSGGRSVRRMDPEPGQPLTLAVSVRPGGAEGLYGVLFAVVLVAGLLAVGAAWWLGNTTTRPLTELTDAVERVAGGDLAARVPVRSRDEVGRLAASFNRMTRETQGYVQALTASRDQLRRQLGVLGDTLSSTHDLQRILEVILRTATAATGARAGVVLLSDASGTALVGQCAEGVPDADDLRISLGEGLLGGVAGSGEPRRGRVDRDGPLLSEREPACLTYVAVPFAVPGAGPVVDPNGEPPHGAPPPGSTVGCGVLALYDRHGFDEFDDADLTTLRTFAGQAAVALDNVRVHEEAQRLSLTDPLTGLSNYRYLRESLRREVERASRFGRTLAVLVLDLDRFKEINDRYGHAAGDAVLAEFARRLRGEIREVDFAFRQGGEEFVVLLPETDAPGGAVVASRLCAAVRRTPMLVVSARYPEPARIPVSVSIGVAIYPDHGSTGAAVLEAADDALYDAKGSGRDTYRAARGVSERPPRRATPRR